MMTTPTISRRSLLKGACCSVAAASTLRVWTPSAAFGQVEGDRTLVVVFLRGALDGLNAVVPHAEPAYYAARPTIAIPASEVIDLDGRFGLHPAMAPLKELYDAGTFLPLHAAGSPDPTRSHFDAQANMDGGRLGGQVDSNGWLVRHLAELDALAVPMHAVAWGTAPPASLRGDSGALTMPSLDVFRIDADPAEGEATDRALRSLYAGDRGVLSAPSKTVFRALDLVARVRNEGPQPQGGAVYPTSHLGNALREIARTINTDVGLLSATVDVAGWDLHAGAGTHDQGNQQALLADLASSLHAFATDLGDRLSRTTLVVMSEFGRRVEENGSGGTDHGHGNVMFLLGGGLQGRRVAGEWVGLGVDSLFRGDVPVTSDFRDVLGEVLQRRFGNADPSSVFLGHRVRPLGLTT